MKIRLNMAKWGGVTEQHPREQGLKPDLAQTAGADPIIMSWVFVLWTWYPLILLVSLTIGYLVENQRRSPY